MTKKVISQIFWPANKALKGPYIFTMLAIMFFNAYVAAFSQTQKKLDYQLTIDKGKVIKINKDTFLIISTTLINNTTDTLKYFSNSCSWQDYYSVNDIRFKIQHAFCKKNIPVILMLAPYQNKTIKLKLLTSHMTNTTPIDLKIGFHLVREQVFMDNYDFQEQLNKNIIWSNQIFVTNAFR